MKAAWDWHLPRETPEQERELAAFTADLGFDTLVVRDPTRALVDAAHDANLDVVAIVDARPTDSFREAHPECLQQLHPAEEAVLAALEDAAEYQRRAHLRYPYVHGTDFLCFERERALDFLETRVTDALDVADGVAFDGFGFRNHHACYCDHCRDRREARERATDCDEYDALASVSRDQLVETAERLYDHAKDISDEAVVMNHVWPPFAPDPYYAHRLRLDYCSQTIAWFYRPDWSLERVAFEAAEHERLAGEANDFVPFIGLYDDPTQRRSPERVARELSIAAEYGDGDLVFCTLEVPSERPAYADVLREALG